MKGKEEVSCWRESFLVMRTLGTHRAAAASAGAPAAGGSTSTRTGSALQSSVNFMSSASPSSSKVKYCFRILVNFLLRHVFYLTAPSTQSAAHALPLKSCSCNNNITDSGSAERAPLRCTSPGGC